jgi:hypothetical protein
MGMQTGQNQRRGRLPERGPESVDHEIALMGGRPDSADPHLINQISMRVGSLDDLRVMRRRLVAEGYRIEGVVNHASAIGCYFFDPEGNRTEVFWVTGRPCWVPTATPIDIDAGRDRPRRGRPRLEPAPPCPGGRADDRGERDRRGDPPALAHFSKEAAMSLTLSRRSFLAGSTILAAGTAGLPTRARAQSKPVRIGLLTVKTGPLAAGGIQMEQGTLRFLKDRIAGTGGSGRV